MLKLFYLEKQFTPVPLAYLIIFLVLIFDFTIFHTTLTAVIDNNLITKRIKRYYSYVQKIKEIETTYYLNSSGTI